MVTPEPESFSKGNICQRWEFASCSIARVKLGQVFTFGGCVYCVITPDRYSFVKSVQYLSLLGSCSAVRFWPYIEALFYTFPKKHLLHLLITKK